MLSGWRHFAWLLRARQWLTAATTLRSSPYRLSYPCSTLRVSQSSILPPWTSRLRSMLRLDSSGKCDQRWEVVCFSILQLFCHCLSLAVAAQDTRGAHKRQGSELAWGKDELYQGLAVIAGLWSHTLCGKIPWREEGRADRHCIQQAHEDESAQRWPHQNMAIQHH